MTGQGWFRHMFDARTLNGIAKTICEQGHINVEGLCIPDHTRQWVERCNELLKRIDVWGFSEPDPEPGCETVKINCRIYASEDGGAVPRTSYVVIMHWDPDDAHAGQLIIGCMEQLIVRMVRSHARVMRLRENHGVDPWLSTRDFKGRKQRNDRLP